MITSTRQFFLDLIDGHEPQMLFSGSSVDDYKEWRKRFYPKFLECLGRTPEPKNLAATTQWQIEEDGMTKSKIFLRTALHTQVPAIVIRPEGQIRGAIVAVHGHGPCGCGKDPVAGASYPEAEQERLALNYGYGIELAREGYVVICPDLRPFGERGDTMPGEREIKDRDPCNVHALKGWLLGFNLLTYNLWDLGRCVDYLIDFQKADPGRIGCIGLSGGGTAAMHLGAMDERVCATAIICALNSYRHWAFGIDNFCGTQFLPGIFCYGDQAEICGLHAPRPIHFEIGGFDYGFPVSASIDALQRVMSIYAAAGAAKAVTSHVGYGAHQYYGTASAFFARVFS